MDHASEQQMEIEALEAIFMDELEEYTGIDTGPEWPAVGKTYKLVITPTEEGEEDVGDELLEMELLFAHTAQYPEEAPCLRALAVYGLSDSDVAACSAKLQEVVEENMGMAMIYTVIEAAKEWLRNRAEATAEVDPEEEAKRAAAEEEAKRAAARAHGTMVTVERFMEWKAAFEAEMAAAKAKAEAGKEDDKGKRLTGKQWFLQDRQDAATEAEALSEDDEEDFDLEDGEGQADEDIFDDDEDYDLSDDDEDFLEEIES